MKLKFKIDKEIEWQSLINIKKDISEDDFELFHTLLEEPLLWSVSKFQEVWDLINDEFSDYIERITGYSWFHNEYECILAYFLDGLSNWGVSNKIIIFWGENPFQSRKVIAHELILSHYFHIYKKQYQDEGLTDGQVWALAEIAAFAICSLTEDVKKWWPWLNNYYLPHQYPQISALQNDMEHIFLKRADFDEYMKKGFDLVKKYPDMGPSV